MIIAHFAPKSCKDYKDIKKFLSKFCKIDRKNPCMAMFAWILAKSLHKEAGGEWIDEEAKKAIELRTVFVDAKIFVTEETKNHANEFKVFCSDAGISMAQMNLIGAIIVGVHIKHYQLGKRKSPMAILLASTTVRNELFPQWNGLFVPHGQVWATKTLANTEQYPLEKLDQFSFDLVKFYNVIAQDIGNPEYSAYHLSHRQKLPVGMQRK